MKGGSKISNFDLNMHRNITQVYNNPFSNRENMNHYSHVNDWSANSFIRM